MVFLLCNSSYKRSNLYSFIFHNHSQIDIGYFSNLKANAFAKNLTMSLNKTEPLILFNDNALFRLPFGQKVLGYN